MDQYRLLKGVFAGLAFVVVAVSIGIPGAAHADSCVNGTVRRGGSGDDYFLCQGNAWLHVVPTHQNSGDGYGNQPLPPLCVRFPDQYTCPTDGPPPN
jgi:hypothetical protein